MIPDKYKYINKVINLYTKSKVDSPAKDEFHKWLTEEESASEKEEALFRLWDQTEGAASEDTLQALMTLESKSQLQTEKKKQIFSISKYAAAIVFIIAATSLFFFIGKPSSEINLIENFSEAGKSDTILLPDGSIILSNSKTVVIYPESFGKDSRTIYLSGEANFKVRKDEKIPFIVKSNGFSITALGTEFDVSSYPDDSYFKTTLISGSIKIEQINNPTDYILSAGDQFAYDKKTLKPSITTVDISEATAWQRGELIFRGVTIKEILNVLERNHNVSFQYRSDIFNDDKYNLRFKKDAPLSDIMEILKKVADNFDYRKVDDSYYINK